MWRNVETREFVDWLHERNAGVSVDRRTGFFGVDLYSLYTSVQEVTKYLDDVDPALARLARQRYGCLSPWESDPAAYGHAALTGHYRECEGDVTAMLVDLLQKRQRLARLMEPARHAYVFDLAARDETPRGRSESGRLGA
jgi:protein-L-isoaspartate(D-aspartate) O-methyltransferase